MLQAGHSDVVLVDTMDELPSLADIQLAHMKLRALCLPGENNISPLTPRSADPSLVDPFVYCRCVTIQSNDPSFILVFYLTPISIELLNACLLGPSFFFFSPSALGIEPRDNVPLSYTPRPFCYFETRSC